MLLARFAFKACAGLSGDRLIIVNSDPHTFPTDGDKQILRSFRVWNGDTRYLLAALYLFALALKSRLSFDFRELYFLAAYKVIHTSDTRRSHRSYFTKDTMAAPTTPNGTVVIG